MRVRDLWARHDLEAESQARVRADDAPRTARGSTGCRRRGDDRGPPHADDQPRPRSRRRRSRSVPTTDPRSPRRPPDSTSPAPGHSPREAGGGRVRRLRSVGTTRRMMVYTPPGYSAAKRYPGALPPPRDRRHRARVAGARRARRDPRRPRRRREDRADARGLPQRTRPEGRSARTRTSTPTPPPSRSSKRDLFGKRDPFRRIPLRRARRDRDHRALAGLSMGGGQALNIGLAHPEAFAWVGAFSPAPQPAPPGGTGPG